jgi:hypothetical protein
MSRKRPKIVQRCFLALALLGAALHVGAFAWHPYARSWTILTERQLLADVQAAICHSTGLITSSDAPGDGRTPPTPAHKNALSAKAWPMRALPFTPVRCLCSSQLPRLG